jgi:hypothetical protein
MNNQPKERINAKINFKNYTTLGAAGKKILYERQTKAMNFCKSVGKNVPTIRKKFPNITNKQTLDQITNTIFDYCSKLPSEQDLGQKGLYVDYLSGIADYYSNVKRSTSPTLEFLKENEPSEMNSPGPNSGASTPKAFIGGRRRKTRGRGKRHQRKRITRRK